VIEIERKFLVQQDRLTLSGGFSTISQWYIMRGDLRSLRVRKKNDQFIMTVKAGGGISRLEIERELTREEAEGLIACAIDAPIVKRRYEVPVGEHVWEVDIFAGSNEGLILAEIELNAEDEAFERPAWLGREVTTDPRFQNVNLAINPVSLWREDLAALQAR
jgi:CYTH domain-containing protein